MSGTDNDIGLIGVAISTTGDSHRLAFLETCVIAWAKVLTAREPLVVTVDGDDLALDRAHCTIMSAGLGDRVDVIRMGQREHRADVSEDHPRFGRLGVAVNKNTGIEALMDAGVAHLFLCDDDTWPLMRQSLDKHTGLNLPHSMICWGNHRRPVTRAGTPGYAEWAWPRGVLLYVTRSVVMEVGGMDERFGPGGHEHVEWSRRIHQARFTPAPYITPASYAERGVAGPATRASALWHCEDMPKKGEPLGNLRIRRRKLTSVRRLPGDWPEIEQIMKDRDGDTSFVPFRAHENGRESATLCVNLMGLGAGGEQE